MPLGGGVGAGVPEGVASLPFAAVFSDASLPVACNTPPDDPPLFAARAASNFARASASISFCIEALAFASKSPPDVVDAVPSLLFVSLSNEVMRAKHFTERD